MSLIHIFGLIICVIKLEVKILKDICGLVGLPIKKTSALTNSDSASVSLVLMIQVSLTQKVRQQGIETEGTSGKLTLIG